MITSLILFLKWYFSITFLTLNFIYYKLNVFYRSLKYKDKETGKEIDLNEKYDAFHPYDPINYFEFILFGIFLFPIRGIICFLICICLNLNLKYLKYKYKILIQIHSKMKFIQKLSNFGVIYFFVLIIYL